MRLRSFLCFIFLARGAYTFFGRRPFCIVLLARYRTERAYVKCHAFLLHMVHTSKCTSIHIHEEQGIPRNSNCRLYRTSTSVRYSDSDQAKQHGSSTATHATTYYCSTTNSTNNCPAGTPPPQNPLETKIRTQHAVVG